MVAGAQQCGAAPRVQRLAATAALSVVPAPKRKQAVIMGVDALDPQIVNEIAEQQNPAPDILRHVYGMHLEVVHPSRNSAEDCKSLQKANPNCFGGLGYKPRKKAKEENFESGIARSEQVPFGGLKNLGATCYMNSMLQCLYHNKRFRNGVFELARHGAMSEEVRNRLTPGCEDVQRSRSTFNPASFSQPALQTERNLCVLRKVEGIVDEQQTCPFSPVQANLLPRKFFHAPPPPCTRSPNQKLLPGFLHACGFLTQRARRSRTPACPFANYRGSLHTCTYQKSVSMTRHPLRNRFAFQRQFSRQGTSPTQSFICKKTPPS
jgi:hypothetical protein